MKLSNAWLRSGALARLPPEALRVLWCLVYLRPRVEDAAEVTLTVVATVLRLTRWQVRTCARALLRARLVHYTPSSGYTAQLPTDFTKGFTRWSMEDKMLASVKGLTGSEAKILLAVQSLVQGYTGWRPIRTTWLMQIVGQRHRANFFRARKRLIDLGLIKIHPVPRKATRYQVLVCPPPALPRIRVVTGGTSATEKGQICHREGAALSRTTRGEATSVASPDKIHPSGGGARGARPQRPIMAVVATGRVCHETLHIAFRALHLKPLSPGSAYGRKALASMRARLREGFTIEELLTVARYAGRERADADAKGRGQYVRKLRNLCYVWGPEASVLLADATAPAVAPLAGGPYRMEPGVRERTFARLKAESDAQTRDYLTRTDHLVGET